VGFDVGKTMDGSSAPSGIVEALATAAIVAMLPGGTGCSMKARPYSETLCANRTQRSMPISA